MTNSLSPFSPTYWSRRMGMKRYKQNVFRSLASFEERAVLVDGQEVNRPYRSDIVVEAYTKGTALSAQDLTATDDKLQVNKTRAMLFYVDNIDKIQNKYDTANAWIEEAMQRLNNQLDAEFLYEAINAANTVDAGTLGGTSGQGIVLSTSNILNLFGKINRKLDAQNVPQDKRFFVMSPQAVDILWQFIAGKNSVLGDTTGEYANIGTWGGLKLYNSNNLVGSAVTTPVTTPSDTDTVTINGVTFTFKTSIGSTAGNILINGSVANSLLNLAALINAGGVTTDAGVSNVSLSTANKRTVQNWVAVLDDPTTPTKITVRVKGASYLTVSASGTNTVWTAATQVQHCLAGYIGSIDMVVQAEPTVEMASTVSNGTIGKNILPYSLYGVKTFNQGKNEIVDVQLRSDAY